MPPHGFAQILRTAGGPVRGLMRGPVIVLCNSTDLFSSASEFERWLEENPLDEGQSLICIIKGVVVFNAELRGGVLRVRELKWYWWSSSVVARADLSELQILSVPPFTRDLNFRVPDAVDYVTFEADPDKFEGFANVAAAANRKLALRRFVGPLDGIPSREGVPTIVHSWVCSPGPQVFPENVKVMDADLSAMENPLGDVLAANQFEVVRCTLEQFDSVDPPDDLVFVITDPRPISEQIIMGPRTVGYYWAGYLWCMQGLRPRVRKELREVWCALGWKRGMRVQSVFSEEDRKWMRDLDAEARFVIVPESDPPPRFPLSVDLHVRRCCDPAPWTLETFVSHVECVSSE